MWQTDVNTLIWSRDDIGLSFPLPATIRDRDEGEYSLITLGLHGRPDNGWGPEELGRVRGQSDESLQENRYIYK